LFRRIQPRPRSLPLLAVLGLIAQPALALDELAALTDETIKSACHGYVLHELAERLAGWFGSDSPLCRRVSAGEPPRQAIAALRAHGLSAPPSSGSGAAAFRSLPDRIAMECDNDVLCQRERRRAEGMGHPLDMAAYQRVRSHCESIAYSALGVSQGVYGCIEQALADWPNLRLARPVRLLPMQGNFETTGSLELLDAAHTTSAAISRLESGRPLSALARSEDGAWLQVRDGLSGAIGFVPTSGVRRASAAAATQATAPTALAASAIPPSLDIDALVRSGQVIRQHQLNEQDRLDRQRRDEEARLAAEREHLAREQAERERLAALQRQREQQQAAAGQSGGDGLMRGIAGAAVVGLGAAAIGRGVPVDRAAEVVGAGLADIMSGGETRHSARVLEQASAGSTSGTAGVAGSPSRSVTVLPNALDAAGRPRYRDCTIFQDPTGFDALALARLCNAAEERYLEYQRLAQGAAEPAAVQRAWEAHRSAAVNLMVFIDSQMTAKNANGF
jgi:hypothetical protein